MVENQPQLRLIMHCPSNPRDALRKYLPLFFSQPVFRFDAACVVCPLRDRTIIIGEDNQGVFSSHFCQQARRLDCGRLANFVRISICKGNGDKGPNKLQPPRLKFPLQLFRRSGQKPPIP